MSRAAGFQRPGFRGARAGDRGRGRLISLSFFTLIFSQFLGRGGGGGGGRGGGPGFSRSIDTGPPETVLGTGRGDIVVEKK